MKLNDKNGLAEWKDCTDEQRQLIAIYFQNYCSGMRCLNMNCRNSPKDILRCPLFKKWNRERIKQEEMERKVLQEALNGN